MITIRPYDAAHRAIWNGFIGKAKNSSFLFNRDYMEYHSDRFRDRSVLIFSDDLLVAVFPACESPEGISSHAGLSYGGVVLNYDVRLEEVLSYFYYIVKYYHDLGVRQIRYKCFPSCLTVVAAQEDLYALYMLDASLVRRDANSVWTRGEDISYNRGKRYNILKGSKSPYEFRESHDPDAFWNYVLVPNLGNRHGILPTHSVEEMRLLMNSFPASIHLHEAHLAGHIQAGAVVFELSSAIHFQYLSATAEGRSNGALDVLVHELITKRYSNKNVVSFGHSNEDSGRRLNRGLVAWKEGFGARTQALDVYLISTANFGALSSYE